MTYLRGDLAVSVEAAQQLDVGGALDLDVPAVGDVGWGA